jgi:hypothetical protein
MHACIRGWVLTVETRNLYTRLFFSPNHLNILDRRKRPGRGRTRSCGRFCRDRCTSNTIARMDGFVRSFVRSGSLSAAAYKSGEADLLISSNEQRRDWRLRLTVPPRRHVQICRTGAETGLTSIGLRKDSLRKAVFSWAKLAAPKSARCRARHCSILFVFVNFCPNID